MNDLFSYAAETLAPSDKLKPATKAVTVSQLANQLKLHVEAAFTKVRVEGEISGFKRAASGHVYFDLKDENNVINCVMWRSVAENITTALADGAYVVVQGKLTTYSARSSYQIVVSQVTPAGVGALMQRFEQLKKALMAEGLFDDAHKQPLPLVPGKIGIVTSPTGAVIDDMLHRISARFPRPVMVYPALVQGAGAKEQIAAGVAYFNALTAGEQPDVIIVARGGGSLEDLWPFNEELVVRAVAASTLPVISAVGHEPDVTLCDYAADKRAPTPTAAAEMVVPVRADLAAGLRYYQEKMQSTMAVRMGRSREKIALFQAKLPDPQTVLGALSQRLDGHAERLTLGLKVRLLAAKHRLKIQEQRLGVDLFKARLRNARHLLDKQHQLLQAVAPDAPLKRGYAYVTDDAGVVVKSAGQVSTGDSATLHFTDGQRRVTFGEQS